MTKNSSVLLAAPYGPEADTIRATLSACGLEVVPHALGLSDPPNPATHQLIVLSGNGQEKILPFCRLLRLRLGESFVPILFVRGTSDSSTRQEALEAGVDAWLDTPFTAAELSAQVRAILRIKERNDQLVEKTAEVYYLNKRLQLAHQRVDQELELAHRIQLSFLPQTLPEVPHTRFAVHYRPCGRVGGDFYDVFRLDERHVGFYIADAMGHGVPASLLTIFLKRGVQPKEINGTTYRLVPPNEVLDRLNRDLMEQRLAENPFITMIYGLFDHHEGTVRYARAGHPHPLYIPAQGEPELWKISGSLLGLFEAQFQVHTGRMQPGDKILFYTDGTDAFSFDGQAPGMPSLLACTARHRLLPIGQFIDQLARDLAHPEQTDDLTLLGLEFEK
jgi:sigma-B regulation protein RsbU (phosphoserine phosphatase)